MKSLLLIFFCLLLTSCHAIGPYKLISQGSPSLSTCPYLYNSLGTASSISSSTYIANTINSQPSRSPVLSFINVTEDNKLIFNVELEYIQYCDWMYSYIVDFVKIDQNYIRIYAPTPGSNRDSKQFNYTQPLAYPYAWNRLVKTPLTNQDFLNNNDWMYGWPLSQVWNKIEVVNPVNNIVRYSTRPLTIDEVANFSVYITPNNGQRINNFVYHSELSDNNTIVYSGELWITYVIPKAAQTTSQLLQYDHQGYNFLSYYGLIYNLILPRNANNLNSNSSVDKSALLLSYIYTYLISVTPLTNNSDNNYYAEVIILTQTPPSYSSSQVLINYNQLLFINENLTLVNGSDYLWLDSSRYGNSDSTTFVDASSNSYCKIDSQGYCNQYWKFISPFYDVGTSTLIKDYTMNMQLMNCSLTLSKYGPNCELQISSTKLTLSFSLSGLVGEQAVATAINSYTINLSLQDLTSNNTSINSYFTLDSVISGSLTVNTYTIDPNFFIASLSKFYLCYTVPYGVAPFYGYDNRYGVIRYGCSQEENLLGSTNIYDYMIFELLQDVTKYNFTYWQGSNSNEIYFSFSLKNILLEVGSNNKIFYSYGGRFINLYLHVESYITPRSSVSSKNNFKIQSLESTSDSISMSVLKTFNSSLINAVDLDDGYNKTTIIIISSTLSGILIVALLTILVIIFINNRVKKRQEEIKEKKIKSDPIARNVRRASELIEIIQGRN